MTKEIEKVVEPVAKQESEAKANFRKIIEAYKISNPKKYEVKRAELEAKLASL